MRARRLFSRSVLLAILASAALPARGDDDRGVTLFRDRHQRGPSMTFFDDVPNLKRTPFGSRQASSIDVPPGCTAILYAEPYFRGRSTAFRDDDNNLSNTEVGEDTAASLRVDCSGDDRRSTRRDRDRDQDRDRDRDQEHRRRWDRPAPEEPEPAERGRGVTLFRDRDLRGPAAFFDEDVPDLDDTDFGRGVASSIDVSPGCVATLFELPGFRGRKTEFRERDNNLKNTSVGEDRASSLQVRCR
jgi:hypothetical protein